MNIAKALTWEFWRRGNTFVLPLTLAIPGLLYWLIAAIGFRDFAGTREGVQLHFVSFVVFQVHLVTIIFQSIDTPRSHYVLPVSTRTLVHTSLLYAMLLAGAMYLAMALFMNVVWQAAWPLWGPAGFSMVVAACAVAIAWGLTNSRVLQFAATLLAGGALFPLLVVRFGIHRPEDAPLDQGHWPLVTRLDAAMLLGIIAVSYVVALRGVTRDRSGDGWRLSLTPLVDWLRDAARRMTPFVARGPFRSGRSAQFWFEWQTRGLILPSVALFVTLPVLVLSAFALFSEGIAGTIWSAAACGMFASPILGIALGNRSRSADYGTYDATRPLSDRQLSHAILQNLATSVLATFVLVLLSDLVIVGILWLRGHGPTLLAFAARLPGGRVMWPLVVAGLGLATWTGAGLGASLGVARRVLVTTTLVPGVMLLIVSLVAYRFVIPDDWRPICSRTVQQAFWLVSLLGTLTALTAAYFRRHVSGTEIGLLAAAWLTLTGLATVVWFHLDCPAPELFLFLAPGLAALPLLPLATIPLALSWNRHR